MSSCGKLYILDFVYIQTSNDTPKYCRINTKSTPRGGVNRYKANLMTNDAELKTKCNTHSVRVQPNFR